MSELPLNIYYQSHHGNCWKNFLLVKGFQLPEIRQGKMLRLLFSRFE